MHCYIVPHNSEFCAVVSKGKRQISPAELTREKNPNLFSRHDKIVGEHLKGGRFILDHDSSGHEQLAPLFLH